MVGNGSRFRHRLLRHLRLRQRRSLHALAERDHANDGDLQRRQWPHLRFLQRGHGQRRQRPADADRRPSNDVHIGTHTVIPAIAASIATTDAADIAGATAAGVPRRDSGRCRDDQQRWNRNDHGQLVRHPVACVYLRQFRGSRERQSVWDKHHVLVRLTETTGRCLAGGVSMKWFRFRGEGKFVGLNAGRRRSSRRRARTRPSVEVLEGRLLLSGAFQYFPVNDSGGPNGITGGPDGNLWFTEGTQNRVAKITPSGNITEFSLPPPPPQNDASTRGPVDIITGPDGNLWWTEDFAQQNAIGRITPTGTIS